jgi:peptidyl-prolyl cis-trans isomerase D
MSPKKTQDSSNAFRKNKKSDGSPVGKISLILILTLVVAAFVVAPLFSGLGNSGSGRLVFGSYGNKDIEYSQGSYFYNQVNLMNNMYRDQISQSEDLFDFYRYYIWSSAYSQSVTYAAKTWELENSGFALSDKGLSRLIIQSGYYNNEEGNFDESAYASSTIVQRDEIKASILSSTYLNRFNADTLGGIYRSQTEITSLINTSPVEKQFRYVVFSSDKYPDSEVQAYGEDHKDLFTSYPLSRITVASKEEANKAIKEISEGTKTFAEAAVSYSTDMYAPSEGAMGNVYRYTLIDELGEEKTSAVLSLNEGEYSAEPIETDYGWYVYSLTGAPQNPDFSNGTLLTAVKNWMTWNEAATIDDWVMNKAEAFTSAVDSSRTNSFLQEALKDDLDVKTTDYFPLNWGTSPILGNGLVQAEDSLLQGVASSDDFFETAFALESNGAISSPVILDSGLMVLQLVDSRDSQSLISESTCYNYLQQSQDDIYNGKILESKEYEDNFSDTYYKLFPPENTEES